MQVDLSGKVALITGASKGIGREMALAFGRSGAAVVANYNSDPSGVRREASHYIPGATGKHSKEVPGLPAYPRLKSQRDNSMLG